MDKTLKKEWLKALRSNKYQQGQDRLRHDNTFCCLGVLCDVVHNLTGFGKWVGDGPLLDSYEFRYDDPQVAEPLADTAALSKELLDITGLTDEQQWKLVNLNDDGKSFKDIANYIETHIPEEK